MSTGVKISALPTTASLMSSDIFPLVTGGVTRRAAFSMLPFSPMGSGASGRSIPKKLQDDYVNPEDYGATEGGSATVDNRAALQRAANTGRIIDLAGKTWAIGSQLTWAQNGGGIVGPGAIVMLTGAGQFQETNVANKHNTNACGIYVLGFDDVIFDDFKMSLGGAPSEDNICMAIAIRDSERSKVTWCEFTAFKKSDGVVTFDSSFDGHYVFNNCHDCSTNGAANGQLSGVNVDDDRVASVFSERLNISYNEFKSLTVGATFLAAFGYQTDAINIQGASASRGHTIHGNRIDTVGEGIDVFGSFCSISGNTIKNAYTAGIKLIHGASYNDVGSNVIDGLCKYGINLSGSTTAAQDTQYNHVHDNIISNVNSGGNHTASGVSAGIAADNDGTFDPANNLIQDNTVMTSTLAHWGLRSGTGGGGNEWLDNRLYGTFVTARVQNTNGELFRAANKSYVLAVRATSVQAITTGTLTTVLYNSETTDTNGEYDPTSGIFTASEPRRLVVTAACRSPGGSVGNNWELYISKNDGSTQRIAVGVANAAGEQMILVSGVIELAVGDTLRIKFQHDKGSDINLSAVSASTYLNISEA